MRDNGTKQLRLGRMTSAGFGIELSDRVRKQQLRYRFALFVQRRRQLIDRFSLQLQRPALPLTCGLQPKSDLAGGALSLAVRNRVSQPLHVDVFIARGGRKEGRSVGAERTAAVVHGDVPPRSKGLLSAAASEPSRPEPVQDGRRTYAKSRCRYRSRDLAGHPPMLLA